MLQCFIAVPLNNLAGNRSHVEQFPKWILSFRSAPVLCLLAGLFTDQLVATKRKVYIWRESESEARKGERFNGISSVICWLPLSQHSLLRNKAWIRNTVWPVHHAKRWSE